MLEAGKFIKKETPAQVFSCKFCKTFKVIYFAEQVPATASGPKTFYNIGASGDI